MQPSTRSERQQSKMEKISRITLPLTSATNIWDVCVRPLNSSGKPGRMLLMTKTTNLHKVCRAGHSCTLMQPLAPQDVQSTLRLHRLKIKGHSIDAVVFL